MGFEYAFFIVSVPEGYVRFGLDIIEEPSGFDVVLAWEIFLVMDLPGGGIGLMFFFHV